MLFLLTYVPSCLAVSLVARDPHPVFYFVLCNRSVQATPEMGKETLAASVEEKWDTMDYKMLGIRYVRGCEVVDVLDESKKVIGERDKDGRVHSAVGSVRTFRVLMDAAQYEVCAGSTAAAVHKCCADTRAPAAVFCWSWQCGVLIITMCRCASSIWPRWQRVDRTRTLHSTW